LKDEHVVIIGCGESAMDIASLDFQIRGNFIGGRVPLDCLNTNLFETTYVHYVVIASQLRFRFIDFVTNMVLTYLTGDDGEAGQEVGVLSTQVWRKVYVNRKEEIMPYINGPYKRRVSGGITTTDRWINTCTMPSYIFPTGLIHFTPDLNRKDYERALQLCRHLVAPEDPTIAYLGFLRSWVDSSGPLGEMQAMWWLAHLQGDMSRLPTSPEHYTLLTRYPSLPLLLLRPSSIGPAIAQPYEMYGPKGSCPVSTLYSRLMRPTGGQSVWHTSAEYPGANNILDEILVDLVANILMQHVYAGTRGVVHASSSSYIPKTLKWFLEQPYKHVPVK
ncbi:hypothetical protein IFR05_015866, partial [Cadophora sp. M221]